MTAHGVMEILADRFIALGANPQTVRRDLMEQARRQLSSILDKYHRFTPPDHVAELVVDGIYKIRRGKIAADIAIRSANGARVPAARIIYDEEVDDLPH